MQAIVIKYIQLFCVAVLFDSVSCDQITLKGYKDDLLFYQTTSCTASCLKNDVNKTLVNCYHHCQSQKFNDVAPEYVKTTNFKIKLLCRDDSSLVLKIVDSENPDDKYDDQENIMAANKTLNNSMDISNSFQYSAARGTKKLYMVKVQNGNVISEKIFYIAESPLIQIKKLAANTSYNVTGTIINSNFQYTYTTIPEPITTLSVNYKPENVRNICLSEFKLSHKSNDKLEVLATWEPAYDGTCRYYIYTYDWNDDSTDPPIPYVITQPELLYQYTMGNLSFDHAYRFGVMAVNSKNSDLSSEVTWINVTTPTCWEWYTNDTNLEICSPFEPTNITVSVHFVSKNLYNMNIKWDKPERLPLYYSIEITANYSKTKMNISGDQTYAYIENVEVQGSKYQLKITAYSLGGSTSSGTLRRNLEIVEPKIVDEKSQNLTILFYIGGPILAVIILGVFIVSYINFRARSRRRRYREEYFEGLDKDRPTEAGNKDKQNLLEDEIKKSFLSDGMEIDEKDIKMLDVIGEGAFGFVTRAILLPSGKEVAVKMLKNVATFDVMQNFCQEVEVMRSVDKHPNIVGIVGHCMKDIEKMMLLTEYCSEGNLLDFLRNTWKRLMKCPITTCRSDREFSFQKPTESEFNFGSSIPEKNIIKIQKIHDSDHGDDLPEYDLKNLIINKLYDECNGNNNLDSKRFYTHECNNSCKSYVDIIGGSPISTNGGEAKVNRVTVKDCDCKENRKNKALNHLNQPISIVENRGYDAENNIKKFIVNNPLERTLTKRDLLSFASQIATGMEFLSINKVVHRDLAARNVCVCSDLTVKIADFGLSRDIYQENVYKKSSEGKLPIKWLALESMTFQMYTSQSDVWSYGILLYEIVTLGSTPYPSLQTGSLLKLLMSGYRMEKPPNCDDKIYELMLSCWKTVPVDRPTFTEIKIKLERILSEFNDDQPIHNNMFDENLRSIVSSDESYLKPI